MAVAYFQFHQPKGFWPSQIAILGAQRDEVMPLLLQLPAQGFAEKAGGACDENLHRSVKLESIGK
jgi:hypothetical protein